MSLASGPVSSLVPGNAVAGTSGVVQDKANAGSVQLTEYIRTINDCYPEEIVRYYSPGYSATLLDKIDSHNQPHRRSQADLSVAAL